MIKTNISTKNIGKASNFVSAMRCSQILMQYNRTPYDERPLNKTKLSGNGKNNVKCDKCSSNFTSKITLSQHMFATHIPYKYQGDMNVL